MTKRTEFTKRLESDAYSRSKAQRDFKAIIDGFTHAMATPGRGVLILGDTGNGKTSALKQLLPRTAERRLFDCKIRADVDKLVNSDADARVSLLISQCHNVMLDDLGRDQPFNDYGTKHDTVYDFVIAFYEHKQSERVPGGRLFATSNLTREQLRLRYDDVFMDRLLDMVTVVNFHGHSQRKGPSVFGAEYGTVTK